jgi:hypothetical protein
MKDVFYTIASIWMIIITLAFIVIDGPEEYEKNLLKEVTLNEETHIIVNYDWWEGTYTMDNGVEYSVKIVKKLLGANYEE